MFDLFASTFAEHFYRIPLNPRIMTTLFEFDLLVKGSIQ